MEDKEKILSEVDRLTKCYYDEKHGKSHNPLTRARLTGMIEALEIVHDYIGSMQAENKEPANSSTTNLTTATWNVATSRNS